MTLSPREQDALTVIAFLAAFALFALIFYKYVAPAIESALN
jgi:F0F1-type ATP synthase membrane subunit b/b'